MTSTFPKGNKFHQGFRVEEVTKVLKVTKVLSSMFIKTRVVRGGGSCLKVLGVYYRVSNTQVNLPVGLMFLCIVTSYYATLLIFSMWQNVVSVKSRTSGRS